jgi:hypothetical protein
VTAVRALSLGDVHESRRERSDDGFGRSAEAELSPS